MKSIISCIVLAALLALVSADCDFKYLFGQKCGQPFCDQVNATSQQCQSELKEKFLEEFKSKKSRRSFPGPAAGGQEARKKSPFSKEQKEAMFEKGEEFMHKCLVDKLNAASLDEYTYITDFCDKTSIKPSEEKDAEGNPIRTAYNECVGKQSTKCCGLKHHFGGKHGGHGGGHKGHGGGHGGHGGGHGGQGGGHGSHGGGGRGGHKGKPGDGAGQEGGAEEGAAELLAPEHQFMSMFF